MTDHERGCQGREYTCTCGSDAAAQALADAQTHAVKALKAETITLRNEIAALKGRLLAQAHTHPGPPPTGEGDREAVEGVQA